MILPLKRYPDNSVNVNAGPVRGYKDGFKQMVDDIEDTMKEHNLDALSAIEIGYPYQIMIIKIDGKYKMFSNPRIITQKEPFASKEKTYYLFNQEIEVQRFETLSVVYDDKNGEMKTFKIEDKELASRFLRTSDYLFNTTLLDRLKLPERNKVIAALSGKGEMPSFIDITCPTTSKRDYFISVADKLLFFMFISLLLPLFHLSKGTLNFWYGYDKFAFVAIFLLLIGFFFYAQYEAKKYKQCTSCQIGNQIGFIIKRSFANIVFFIGAYFIFAR